MEHLTTQQVAKRYGIARTKVLGWIRCGELRAINVASNVASRPRWVVSPAELDRFELIRSSQPAPQPVRKQKNRVPRTYY